MLKSNNWQETPGLTDLTHVAIILLILMLDLDFIAVKLYGIPFQYRRHLYNVLAYSQAFQCTQLGFYHL